MIASERIVIRPFNFSDADYDGLLRIYVANFPDTPTSAEIIRFQDEKRAPDKLFSRNVVEVDGRHVGTLTYSELPWSDGAGLYALNLLVTPAMQRQGVGRLMYDYALEQLKPHKPQRLRAITRDDQVDAQAMLEKRGFTLAMEDAVSALTVSEFDLDSYASLVQRMEDEGIRIRSLEEIQQTDTDWQQQMYDLKWTLLQDVPTIDPMKPMPFDKWIDKQFGDPGFQPDAWFVAEDMTQAEQPCYIGLSHLYRNQASERRLDVGLTGVLGDYRRRGIATALKVRTIAFAKFVGATEVWTDNAADNPMYQLNMALGFRPKPSMLIFNKTIKN